MRDFAKRINPKFYISLSGILLGLTVVFAEIGALAYLALIPMALVLFARISDREYKIKTAYLDGFVFFVSYYLVCFHWFVYYYPLDFLGISKAGALFIVALAWFGLSLLQAAFSSLVFVAFALLSKSSVCQKRPVLMPTVAAALFVINEWSQTLGWAGVPWGRISISQTQMPILMQSASLFGSYFLTFIIVLVNFLLAFAILKAEKRQLMAFVALFVVTVNAALGAILYHIPTVNEDKSIKIAALQGNLPSQEDRGLFLDGTFEVYEKLARDASNEGAQVIVMPEGAFATPMNGYVRDSEGKMTALKPALQKLSSEIGATVIVGTYVDLDDEGFFNSLSAFYPDGESDIGVYSKRRLVPFGEFLPLRSFIETVAPVLSMINIVAEDITPGKSAELIGATREAGTVMLAPLICYDAIFETLALESARMGGEVLIIPSNDSWFYDSRALNMHHAQNILRAVEQGKFTLSCGNTGITSIVSDKGELVCDMPIYTEGYVIDTVYASSGRTLYSYIGNLFVYLCMFFLLFMVLHEFAIKRMLRHYRLRKSGNCHQFKF